eukprot:scaffold1231_cov69-Phaeocystis_antarctica.AAC.3
MQRARRRREGRARGLVVVHGSNVAVAQGEGERGGPRRGGQQLVVKRGGQRQVRGARVELHLEAPHEGPRQPQRPRVRSPSAPSAPCAPCAPCAPIEDQARRTGRGELPVRRARARELEQRRRRRRRRPGRPGARLTQEQPARRDAEGEELAGWRQLREQRHPVPRRADVGAFRLGGRTDALAEAQPAEPQLSHAVDAADPRAVRVPLAEVGTDGHARGAASASTSEAEARRRKPRDCRARVDEHAKAAGGAAGNMDAHESGALRSVDEEGRGRCARRGLLELLRRLGHLHVPVSCYELAPGVEDDDAEDGEDEDECDVGSRRVDERGQPAHRPKAARRGVEKVAPCWQAARRGWLMGGQLKIAVNWPPERDARCAG